VAGASRGEPTDPRPWFLGPEAVPAGRITSALMADDDPDVKQSVRMTADRLLVTQSKEAGERKSRAGIVIPATAAVDRRLVWAEVVAVGPTVRNIEPGDRVLFSPDAGFDVEIRAEEYVILRERDVHAVASPRSESGTGLYL
jgi:chaperonin GroES